MDSRQTLNLSRFDPLCCEFCVVGISSISKKKTKTTTTTKKTILNLFRLNLYSYTFAQSSGCNQSKNRGFYGHGLYTDFSVLAILSLGKAF